MSYILSLETATKACSVAIHFEGKTITVIQNFTEKSHAERLHALIEAVLVEAKITLKDLKAVAISAGPGSYTGLRIASSLAKGLCFALQIPLIAINTLQSMALEISMQGFLVCPMLDARRMEVYCAIYDFKNDIIHPTQAKVIENDSFKEVLETNQILFFGDGSAKCKELINHKNAFFMDNKYPNAAQIGIIAFQKFKKNNFEDLAYFEPHYLKEFYTTSKVLV